MVDDINARQSTLSEALFDAAEEHALDALLDAWNDASANDLSVFQKVGAISLRMTSREDAICMQLYVVPVMRDGRRWKEQISSKFEKKFSPLWS